MTSIKTELQMKRLTPKEEQVMELLWEHGPLFVREMLEYYEEPRPHFNTVSTVVRMLEEQSYIAHKAYGRNHQYYAAISRDDFKKKTLKGVISKYFNNSYLGAVSTLVKEEDISLDELKELISEVEKEQDQ